MNSHMSELLKLGINPKVFQYFQNKSKISAKNHFNSLFMYDCTCFSVEKGEKIVILAKIRILL